jgi:nucleoside-diphosphate-sugar epimerase
MGWRVTAVARRPCADADLIADLRQPVGDWPSVDAVIHLAGGYAGASWRELEEADIRIARNLIAWGREAGVTRWVFASAAEVYGRVTGVAEEDWPCRPVIPYGFAKLEVERLFQAAGFAGLTICRLGEVYGRQGRILQEIPRRLRSGFCPWPGDGNIRISFLHVDDAAEALVRACAASATQDRCDIYNVGDSDAATWREFLDRIACTLKTRHAMFLPHAFARCYAALECWTSRLLRRPSAITPRVLQLLTTPKVLSSRKIRECLGFMPRYPNLECGLREAIGGI